MMQEVDLLRNIILTGVLIGFGSVAWAQNVEVITARQEIYKGFGEAAKPLGPMLKGSTPFDAAVVKKALTTFAAGAKKLPDLFPDDSKTGHDTEALPAIWTAKPDFTARLAKLGSDSEAAIASITDQASFAATMPKVLGNCGGCHKEYRAKK
jgi:cytochrome c556